MFRTVSPEDRMKLMRAVMATLFAVIIGVTVVDMQLNDLTRQHEFVRLLNLRRDPREGYSAYLFGTSYPIGAVIPLARIGNNSHEVVLEAGNLKLQFPTKVTVDASRTLHWMQVWSRQFIEEAHKTKRALTEIALELSRQISGYWEQYRYLLQGEKGK